MSRSSNGIVLALLREEEGPSGYRTSGITIDVGFFAFCFFLVPAPKAISSSFSSAVYTPDNDGDGNCDNVGNCDDDVGDDDDDDDGDDDDGDDDDAVVVCVGCDGTDDTNDGATGRLALSASSHLSSWSLLETLLLLLAISTCNELMYSRICLARRFISDRVIREVGYRILAEGDSARDSAENRSKRADPVSVALCW